MDKKKLTNSRGLIFFAALLILGYYLVQGGIPGRGDATLNSLTNPAALKRFMEREDSEFLLLDVRTLEEYLEGHIPGAENSPVETLAIDLPAVPKESLIILYCRTGNRSAQAFAILKKAGYTNLVDFGGIQRWPFDLIK